MDGKCQKDGCANDADILIVVPGEGHIQRCYAHTPKNTPIPMYPGIPYRYGDVEVWRISHGDDSGQGGDDA